MEGRNDPPEYRVSSIARQYIYASFLRRNPQHAGCGHGREYAGAVTISFTQPDASDVTSATASLRRVRPATVVFHFSALAFRADFTLLADLVTVYLYFSNDDRAHAVRYFSELRRLTVWWWEGDLQHLSGSKRLVASRG